MQDNVSIVITIIVLVIIIVIFPLYNFFERQDDMSYNLALKATTNFVDDALNKGYIDQNIYDKFITQLSSTGNIYDVELEAHRKIVTKDPQNPTTNTYVDQYKVDYNSDIFENTTINNASITNLNQKILKNNMYVLNVGDQLYVKLKNSSTTMAGAIFNTIVPTSKKERITVDYGGVVKNNTWAQSKLSMLMQGDIFITIDLVGNANNNINTVNGKPTFYMNLTPDRTVKYRVTILNVDPNDAGNVATILQQNIALLGLESNVSPSSVVRESDTTWIVTFGLNIDLLGYSYNRDAYVSLPANLIHGKYSMNNGVTTESRPIAVVRSNTNTQLPTITGPFDTNGNSIGNVFIGSTVVFYINYFDSIVFANADNIKYELLKLNNFYVRDASTDLIVEADPGNRRFRVTLKNTTISVPVENNCYIEVGSGFGRAIVNGVYQDIPPFRSTNFTIYSQIVWDFAYTGAVQVFTAPSTGAYKLEVWGAQGGSSSGGLGGYSVGTAYLTAGQVLYIYVGGTGGWNGGGSGHGRASDVGGGGTDMRTVLNDLNSRIIVAGGGGGRGPGMGGVGGGTQGGIGSGSYGSPGGGGTQTSGGYGGSNYGGSGSFGQGGSNNTGSNSGGGGGGGGWYGGGAGGNDYSSYNDYDDHGGSGGSGYIGGVFNGSMASGVTGGNGLAKITYTGNTGGNPNLVANITLANEYFNGSTSYSQPGQMENNFTITFDATPTTTTNMPSQGSYAYYSAGVKTYNYVVTDVHGGYLPVAGMGISVGTNGVVIIAHSDNYYYTLLSYSANLTTKHDYKVVVNNRIPSLYIDGTLVRTGVTPVNCTSLIARPSVGLGAYGSYVGYANNFNFYNVAM